MLGALPYEPTQAAGAIDAATLLASLPCRMSITPCRSCGVLLPAARSRRERQCHPCSRAADRARQRARYAQRAKGRGA